MSQLGPSALLSGRSETESEDQNNATHPPVHKHQETSPPSTVWLPYTLRWYWIWVCPTLSLLLGLATILLLWHSQRNHGLSTEGSAVIGWKFIPTLLSVVYTQLICMLFDDIERTEPYARLASPLATTISASKTILETPKEWWTTLLFSLRKNSKSGSRNWLLFLSCLVKVLAFLAISPLSSTLLASEEITLTQPLEMSTFDLNASSPLQFAVDTDMVYQAMSALLYNATTSPWVSDEYFILPFWPSKEGGVSWVPRSSYSAQSWTSNTTVFRNDFRCDKLELAEKWINPNSPATSAPDEPTNTTYSYLLLESSSGCQYNITSTRVSARQAFSSWSDLSRIAFWDWANGSISLKPKYSKQCDGEEMIIVSTPWLLLDEREQRFNPDLAISGYMCSSHYTMANIPVSVVVSGLSLSTEFDEANFRAAQQDVPQSVLDSTQLLAHYIDPSWFHEVISQSYVNATSDLPGTESLFYGAASILAPHYHSRINEVLQDAALPAHAARIRRRLFGEMMRKSLSSLDTESIQSRAADAMTLEQRIVVSRETAYTLFSLFSLSFIVLLTITWLSRPQRRPLNLLYDPATILGVASLVIQDRNTLSSFEYLDQTCKKNLEAALQKSYYSTSLNSLHKEESQANCSNPVDNVANISLMTDWKPSVLKLRTLVALVLYLIALAVAILVLYKFANNAALYQRFFTYQANLAIFGRLGVFTPFSIVPTALAIALSLWWEALDKSIRRLQPFLAIARRDSSMSQEINTSYISTYWLWASVKAITNRHWILALVTLGSFLTQVSIISMSAMFERESGIHFRDFDVTRPLELRYTPYVAEVFAPYSAAKNKSDFLEDDYLLSTTKSALWVGMAVKDLVVNSTAIWMYSAVNQASMNGSEPLWTRDGWNFIPLDVIETNKTTQASKKYTEASSALYSSTNLTFDTPAIRGRLECSPIPEINDVDSWLYSNLSLTNGTSGDIICPVVLKSSDWVTTTLSGYGLLGCWGDKKEQLGSLPQQQLRNFSAGYWSKNFYQPASDLAEDPTGNITVKWINGAVGSLTTIDDLNNNVTQIYFLEVPRFQGLNCMPIIERSNARVTIDPKLGHILSYEIRDEPQSEEAAWMDSFVLHELTDPSEEGNYSASGQLQNQTTSYGNMFMHTLLNPTGGNLNINISMAEQVTGNKEPAVRFSIGGVNESLNLDFMSYASFSRVGKDPEALLDYDILLRETQRTFSSFFTHFVTTSVSSETGGWAYQPRGKQLDPEIGPPTPWQIPQTAPGGREPVKYSDLPAQNTDPVARATLSMRIQVQKMDLPATWLSVAILFCLALVALLLSCLQRYYFRGMMRNVESIADVLILIARSEKFLALVKEKGIEVLKRDTDVYVRLGWFEDSRGEWRWGIEVSGNRKNLARHDQDGGHSRPFPM